MKIASARGRGVMHESDNKGSRAVTVSEFARKTFSRDGNAKCRIARNVIAEIR